MKLSKDVFVIALVVVLAIGGLVLRNFPFNQGNLDKDVLPIITSFDLFADTSYTNYIYESEDARYNPPYRVNGVEKSLTVQPVFFFLFVASLTKLTTLSPYQTTVLVTHLVSVLVALMVFVLVRRYFGSKIGLLALALAAFPQAKWLFQTYIGFLYDQYAFLYVPAILFFLILLFHREITTRQVCLAGVLIGSFVVAQWLSHYVELILYTPLLGMLWLFFAWKNRWNKEYFVLALVGILVFLPFAVYFYPITRAGHLAQGIEEIKGLIHIGKVSSYPSYWPSPRFNTLLNVLGVIGLLFLGTKAVKRQFNSKQLVLLFFIGYLLAIGLSNYIGMDANRAGRQLFNGMAVLVLFPAIGMYVLYGIVSSFKPIQRFAGPVFIVLIGAIVFFAAPKAYADLSAIDSGAFVNDQKWESVEWIKDKTPSGSRVLYLNGFFHEFAMFGERAFMEGWVLPNPEAQQFNFEHLCVGKWTPVYAGHWGAGEFAGGLRYLKERTSLATFTYVEPFTDAEAKKAFVYNNTVSHVPLTLFDYAVVQYKGTQLDPCIGFFLNESLARGHQLAWNNNEMAILKINKEARP